MSEQNSFKKLNMNYTAPPEVEKKVFKNLTSLRFLGELFELYVSKFMGFFIDLLGGENGVKKK